MTGYLVVQIGERLCGVPVGAVRHVVEIDRVHPAPAVHPAVVGVIAHAAAMVPLVALAGVLDRVAAGGAECSTAVLVETQGRLLALGVDGAHAVVRQQPSPKPPGWDVPWANGVARMGERLIPIVDLDIVADRLQAGSVRRPT